ncbi:hypothetical protein CKAH01_15655 [Colletotrichum kahawae]|uniref:Uncharacterized protein n=1 Tax=Colletotrichum kahawae TaxID=34407 RepID=A0AAE0D7L4_COLKA|nr:hypothetical protein CKAH01_15655 [Colletotrichum kahawae]
MGGTLSPEQIMYIVRIVVVALALIPMVVLFAKLVRKPGYRHDTTRRWVDYTKVGFGLWILSHLLSIAVWACLASAAYDRFYGLRYGVGVAVNVLAYIQYLVEVVLNLSIFLAVFYMAHALTQLRTEGEEVSSAFRKGRGFALGGSILVVLLSFVAFCLYLDDRFGRYYKAYEYLVASCFMLACYAILIIMAIGSVVYAAKSRKKALGSGLDQAAKIVVTVASLFLVRECWGLVNMFFGGGYYWSYYIVLYVLDIVLTTYLPLVILVLLYSVATKKSYAMSKMQYQSKATDTDKGV